MRGNTFGKLFSLTTFGESHGPAMGVVLDGVKPGLKFSVNDLQEELQRRAPGNLAGTTARKEEDIPEVLSGIYEGKTLGTPIAIIVRNNNQKSSDYEQLKDSYRPGHADQTTILKYGIRDHRGGGRASGRETVSRVIAAYFAGLMFPELRVASYIEKLGPFDCEKRNIDPFKADTLGAYGVPKVLASNPSQSDIDSEVKAYLLDLKKRGESVGGRVRLIATGHPSGLGEPAFDKLKGDLGKAVLSIGAVVSFSIGLGQEIANLMGSEVSLNPNAFGGIEGGISNGRPISMEIIIKPTSTVGEKALSGRHDPCIIPRALPVLEAMVKIVLADHSLRQKAYE